MTYEQLQQHYHILSTEMAIIRESLKLSQKKVSEFQQIVENANSVIIKLHMNGDVEYINPFAEIVFGKPGDERTRQRVLKAIFPNEKSADREVQHILAEWNQRRLKMSQQETRVVTSSGRVFWLSWTNKMLYDDAGEATGLIAIGTDISKRKFAEEALRESEFNLTKAQEIAKIGSWAWEIDTDNIHCSSYFFRIFDISPMTSYSRLLERLNRIIYPEYRNYINKKIDRAIRKGTTESYTYRIRVPDGDDRWIMEEVSLLGDIHKKKQILIGTIRDITEQKQAEDKLREYLLIVSSSSELMSLIGPDYRYINVNQAYLDAYQRTKEEIEGHTVAEMFGEENFENLIRPKIDRCILGESITDQYWFTFPDGKRRFMDVKYNPVREVDGTISGVTVSARDITELKKTEEQLLIFKRFAEESGVGFGMANLDGLITYVNSTLSRLTGFEKPADIIGKSIEETYLKNHLALIRGEIIPVVMEKGQWTGEIDLQRGDGSIIHTIENFFLIRNEHGEPVSYAISVTDISDRKHAEEALQRSESNFRSIFTNAAIGIDVVDEKGRFLQVNQAMANMMGYTQEELKKLDIPGVTYPEDQDKSRNPLAELFSGRSDKYRIEKRYVRKDGSIFWADLSVTVYYDVIKKRKLAIGTIIDISHSKMLQQELQRSKEEAVRANRAKSEFLANMSHEIRTPLNAVIGFTELLETLVSDPKQGSYLQSIKSGGKNLLMLINDILDLSKIEAGKLEFRYEPVNPYALINEIRQIFALKIKEKDLEFIVEVDDDIPESLILDEVRVRQVIFNLIGNAIKFTEKGHVKFSVEKIYTSDDTSHIDLKVAVEDTGIGIPPEQHRRIFDAFQQQSGQSTRKYGGTGLGLSISKRLVEMMHGEISLYSEVGKGSVFTFTLKDVAVGASVDFRDEADDFDASGLQFAPARIMVVDDVESNRKIISENFSAPNFQIMEAEDGHKAVLFAGQFRPDIIFMDIRMPVMDGFEAAKMIKTKKSTSNIKVVALTASMRSEDQENDYRNYFDGYLRKPVTRTELYRELMRFLPYTMVSKQQKPTENIREDAPDEQLPTLSAAQYSALVAALDGDLKAHWEEARLYQMSDEMEALGGLLIETGEKFGISRLKNYGEALLSAVDSFDLDKMEKYLDGFPAMVKDLKMAVKPPHD